jgi:hypothetical protein
VTWRCDRIFLRGIEPRLYGGILLGLIVHGGFFLLYRRFFLGLVLRRGLFLGLVLHRGLFLGLVAHRRFLFGVMFHCGLLLGVLLYAQQVLPFVLCTCIITIFFRGFLGSLLGQGDGCDNRNKCIRI